MAIAVRFVFLTSFVLVFALLALLKLLSLLLLPAVHLIRLLLLAALELILALLVYILAAQFLLFLILPLLHSLALGILLPLHFVELLFVPLLQSGIGGRVVGMPRGGRAIGFAIAIVAASIRIARVRRAVSVVASAPVVESTAVIGSAVFDLSAMEIARARSGGDFGITVIDGVPEAAIAAGGFKVTSLL